MRYVVECIWSGYSSSQSRPCHRRIIREGEVERYKSISGVQFTDNTTMSVDVRECVPREKVQEIRGYDALFSQIFRQGLTGFVRVTSLRP